jgi:hypothetical protein
MTWAIEYYEQQSGTQPAEVFEDDLLRRQRKLAGKLRRAVLALEMSGNQLGGGLIEKCHGSPGLWEIRVIYAKTLARELFGFDGSRIVLLHGYMKQTGEPASEKELGLAAGYWQEYQRTHTVSPEEPEQQDGQIQTTSSSEGTRP